MNKHPFNQPTFQDVWSEHFNGSKSSVNYKSIQGVKFYKKSNSTLVNIGKNITNGNYYSINADEKDYKGKTFIIYDVPSYFEIEAGNNNALKTKTVRQYKGFTSQLAEFETFDAFFSAQFKSKSRYKYRRNISRLEANFDISYKIFHGDISTDEYETLCKFLKKNLQRRFGSLGLDNNIVSKWDYYYDLMYKMVVNKEAVMTAIYNKDMPIGISFSFLSDSILLFAITSFDIDYMRYNLGHTSIIKLMQWCFENGYNVYDFSKGEYIYKDRWTNHDYDYQCHILYDSKSLKASLTANYYAKYFKLKQYLRDKKVNRLYTQLKFKLKNKQDFTIQAYNIEKLESKFDSNNKEIINLQDEGYASLRYALYQYLYLNPEKVDAITCYKDNASGAYYAIGEVNKLMLTKAD
ncbi:GNAT family N-acetyltransferase [Winogradskyella sp. 3972H.M.0a.05]|uniref:GNAT family N-acetyltransferase n=1 Tax=Winogradskyella sp. 3972H.M.0a.05 TaxID=2950277 RepID=UPI00339302A7